MGLLIPILIIVSLIHVILLCFLVFIGIMYGKEEVLLSDTIKFLVSNQIGVSSQLSKILNILTEDRENGQ